MRVGRRILYAALTVAAAVAYGIGVGPYWLTDLVAFALVACAVGFFCHARGRRTTGVETAYETLRTQSQVGKLAGRPVKRDLAPESDQRERVPRSRIAHYVIVSRIKSAASTAWLRRESDSPFERALLSESEWRKLSGESLEEVVRKVPDVLAKITE